MLDYSPAVLRRRLWLLVAAGLAVMYVPSYLDLARRFWTADEESGPIVLAIVLWLIWRERRFLVAPMVRREEIIVGAIVLFFGLILYAIGRSQEFFQFDIGSQAPVICGVALLLGGVPALRRFWFIAAFTILLVPVPPSLLDQILVPLKVTVSEIVTDCLYSAGYPISHSGVLLVIGQYNLLIADACSGLRSMFALTGIGLLYVYLAGRRSKTINFFLLVAAIPIAFLANILRVMMLVLVTYYFGDEAGSRFHDIAGYFEIVLAFGAFFSLDTFLILVFQSKNRHPHVPKLAELEFKPVHYGARRTASIVIILCCAAFSAIWLAPKAVEESMPPKLLSSVPENFGAWHEVGSGVHQVSLFATDENGQNPMEVAYDDSILRTYGGPEGRQIMVAIGYDRIQREEDRVHRPEICYIAQGFKILSDEPVTFKLQQGGARFIEGRRMVTRNGNRLEAVSYWIRIGSTFTQNPWRSRAYVIEEGLAGRLRDGVLVRVSELMSRPDEAAKSFARQEQFLDAFIAHVPAPVATLLANGPVAISG